MTATTTYVQLVNSAITESGADMATYDPAGSDFNSQSTNSMMPKFKTWVSRAWKTIQQECYDWEFMAETAEVTIDPGIEVYFPTALKNKSYFLGTGNHTWTIYDQDLTAAVPSVTTSKFVDMSGKYLANSSTYTLGYFDIVASGSNPITFALKPGVEKLFDQSIAGASITYTNSITIANMGTSSVDLTSLVHDDWITCYLLVNGHSYIVGLGPNSWNGTTLTVLCSANAVATMPADITAGSTIVLRDSYETTVNYLSFTYTPGVATSSTATGLAAVTATAWMPIVVRGWKSFDFNEEVAANDFEEQIQEINQQSFRIIDYYAGAPAQELPLPFMAWEAFRNSYSQPAAYPGTPRLISEDNTGRWQLYPAPQQRYTIKFDYVRTPQILSAYNDIPKGLNDDFMDVIMWKAIIYYGEYNEQPSIVVRATKHYKDLLARLEQKNREKFHFKPKRLW